MAVELKGMKRRRATHKGQITRLVHALTEPSELAAEGLSVRKLKLEEAYKAFSDVQLEIEEREDDPENETLRAEIENSYFQCHSLILKRLSEISTVAPGLESANQVASSAPIQNMNISQSLLPKINIKQFDGNFTNWNSFYDTFMSLVHENNAIPVTHKFHLLKSYLAADASTAVNSLPASEENYTVAWQLLQKRYNKPRKIIQGHLKELFELEMTTRESPVSFRILAERAEMHINALKALKQPVDWHEMLIYIITAKLDRQTRNSWERSLENEALPTIRELLEFLVKQSQDAEPVVLLNNKPVEKHIKRQNTINRYKAIANNHRERIHAYTSTYSGPQCVLCKQAHQLRYCQKFAKLGMPERFTVVKASKLCYNCLKGRHTTASCFAPPCTKCKAKHHELLHRSNDNKLTKVAQSESSTSIQQGNGNAVSAEILLSTARIFIVDTNNRKHVARALLDSGSQSNFISAHLARRLALKQHTLHRSASGLGGNLSTIKAYINSTICSRITEFTAEGPFLILARVTEPLPSSPINRHALDIPSHINLADPEFDKPSEIDLILGEYFFYKVLIHDQLRMINETTVLQNTQFGWIVSGAVTTIERGQPSTRCHVVTSLETELERFWKLEECTPVKHLSLSEKQCETFYKNTTTRDPTGRYIVRLAFNSKKEQLGESFTMALKRLESLERRFKRDPNLQSRYAKFIEEYESLEHMTEIENTETSRHGYFLPHHAVVRDSSLTTKLRVVFDASAKTSSGLSLNDTLLIGPTLQDDVFSLLTRFRSHSYVLTVDVEKMYRQFLIHPEDRCYQKILWRSEPDLKLKIFQLNTITYGTASAPYLAVRSLQQLAIDEEVNFPLAARVVQQDFYMDDLLTGSNTIEQAKQLRNDLLELTSKGRLNLRQWASNTPELISDLESSSVVEHLLVDSTDVKKTLGVYWVSNKDTFCYRINIEEFPKVSPITKRMLLSCVARLFDPLGLLGPIIIKAKLLIQELWKLQINWDDALPKRLQQLWVKFKDQLPLINEISFPRAILLTNSLEIQLHGFCDASEVAYGACIYIRSIDAEDHVSVRLLCAKSRVAPLKTQSIPRLELWSAVLLARLAKMVKESLRLKFDKIVLWSDSTVALQWIQTSPHILKTFIANRVSEIQDLTEGDHWKHVSTHDNPADYISRGQMVIDFLHNTLFAKGPNWLASSESHWPIRQIVIKDLPEMRNTIACVMVKTNNDWLLRYSSFKKLQRITVYCLRMNSKCRKTMLSSISISIRELKYAHDAIIKAVQADSFAADLRDIKKGTLNNNSRLLTLSPFLDQNGLLRVGGRLKNAMMSFDQKHPILLPKSHHVTKLIMTEYHETNFHSGMQQTLNATRQRYWPIGGRTLARSIVHKCTRCFRAKPKTGFTYPMGDLPKNRLMASRPFENIGIDYCGPFFIKEKRFRNTKKIKAYVALFICFVTKAVHLELVSDLTTEAFLASLRRFFARRGYSRHIYTDNGTNFVGAQRELRELFNSSEHQLKVEREMTERNIAWHFSPPRSPHFGGLWEAAVKSFKYHMIRVIGDAMFTFEQLNTYIIEIEAILNSRPLTPLSPDPNDLQPLTPAHFLIGTSLTVLPNVDFQEVPSNRLSTWQHIQKMRQHFWSRFYKEYLNQLNIRTKWTRNSEQAVKNGMLVIVKEDNVPPMRWPMGRIIKMYPGTDNVVRVVDVKTNTGIYTRNVLRLCPLPSHAEK